jgi:hypothetical protein
MACAGAVKAMGDENTKLSEKEVVELTGAGVTAWPRAVGAALFRFTMTMVIDETELEKYAHAPA